MMHLNLNLNLHLNLHLNPHLHLHLHLGRRVVTRRNSVLRPAAAQPSTQQGPTRFSVTTPSVHPRLSHQPATNRHTMAHSYQGFNTIQGILDVAERNPADLTADFPVPDNQEHSRMGIHIANLEAEIARKTEECEKGKAAMVQLKKEQADLISMMPPSNRLGGDFYDLPLGCDNFITEGAHQVAMNEMDSRVNALDRHLTNRLCRAEESLHNLKSYVDTIANKTNVPIRLPAEVDMPGDLRMWQPAQRLLLTGATSAFDEIAAPAVHATGIFDDSSSSESEVEVDAEEMDAESSAPVQVAQLVEELESDADNPRDEEKRELAFLLGNSPARVEEIVADQTITIAELRELFDQENWNLPCLYPSLKCRLPDVPSWISNDELRAKLIDCHRTYASLFQKLSNCHQAFHRLAQQASDMRTTAGLGSTGPVERPETTPQKKKEKRECPPAPQRPRKSQVPRRLTRQSEMQDPRYARMEEGDLTAWSSWTREVQDELQNREAARAAEEEAAAAE